MITGLHAWSFGVIRVLFCIACIAGGNRKGEGGARKWEENGETFRREGNTLRNDRHFFSISAAVG